MDVYHRCTISCLKYKLVPPLASRPPPFFFPPHPPCNDPRRRRNETLIEDRFDIFARREFISRIYSANIARTEIRTVYHFSCTLYTSRRVFSFVISFFFFLKEEGERVLFANRAITRNS